MWLYKAINRGCWQIYAAYILTRRASSLDRDEVKTGLILANMKNITFPLISIIILPSVLTLC